MCFKVCSRLQNSAQDKLEDLFEWWANFLARRSLCIFLISFCVYSSLVLYYFTEIFEPKKGFDGQSKAWAPQVRILTRLYFYVDDVTY